MFTAITWATILQMSKATLRLYVNFAVLVSTILFLFHAASFFSPPMTSWVSDRSAYIAKFVEFDRLAMLPTLDSALDSV